MSWKIECVVCELKIYPSGVLKSLCLRGCEGYLLKQGDKEYNVFCDSGSENCLYFSVEKEIDLPSLCPDVLSLLTKAMFANKKIRLEFNLGKTPKEKTDISDLSLVHVILLG